MSDAVDGFAKLKQDFPVFKIRNKTNVARGIKLLGGEEVIIHAGTESPIASEDLMQMPDNKFFKCVEPTLDDLVLYGIIKISKPEEAPKETKKTTAAGNSDNPPSDADNK